MSTTPQQDALDQFSQMDSDKMELLLQYIDNTVDSKVEDLFSRYEDLFKAETASFTDKVNALDGLHRLVSGLYLRLDDFKSSLGNSESFNAKDTAKRTVDFVKGRLRRAENGIEPSPADFNKSARLAKDAFRETDQFASELEKLTGRVKALEDDHVGKQDLTEVKRVAHHSAQTAESAFATSNKAFRAMGIGVGEDGAVILGNEGFIPDLYKKNEDNKRWITSVYDVIELDNDGEPNRFEKIEAEQKNIKSQMSSVQVRLTQQEESSVSPWAIIGAFLGASVITYFFCALLFNLGTTPSLFWALGIGAAVALIVLLVSGSSSSDGVSTSTTTAKEKFATFNTSQTQTEPVTKVTPTTHDAPASRGERH